MNKLTKLIEILENLKKHKHETTKNKMFLIAIIIATLVTKSSHRISANNQTKNKSTLTGGRLVYWLPVIRNLYSPSSLPQHPSLNLKYNCEQIFSRKSSRRLLVMIKTREVSPGDLAFITGDDSFLQYRELYFGKNWWDLFLVFDLWFWYQHGYRNEMDKPLLVPWAKLSLRFLIKALVIAVLILPDTTNTRIGYCVQIIRPWNRSPV